MSKFQAGERFVVTDNGNKGVIDSVDVVNDQYTVLWDGSSRTDTYNDMAACEAIWEIDKTRITLRKAVQSSVHQIIVPDLITKQLHSEFGIDFADGTITRHKHQHSWEERQGFSHNFLACKCGASKDL